METLFLCFLSSFCRKGPQRLADYRIDTSAGVLTPIYDQGTGVLALWGKGETSVKFFEINDQQPLIHPLTEYQSTIPQLGFVILPKHLVDVREVEVFKAVKLTQDTVEPISFKVPRQRVRLGYEWLCFVRCLQLAHILLITGYRKSSFKTMCTLPLLLRNPRALPPSGLLAQRLSRS
jgi:hypothetical protein